MEPVRNHRNPRVVEAARLQRAKARRETGLTLLEGPNLLVEALAAGIRPEALFALETDLVSRRLASEHDLPLMLINDAALGRLSETESPRGPVAVMAIPGARGFSGPGVVVSWGLSDPGNVGTMIRTAAAFAWDFAYTAGTADPWGPKVIRAGAGGHLRVAVTPIVGMEELKEAGYHTVALVSGGGESLDQVGSGPFALLVGQEAEGLPEQVVSSAEFRATIPMPGGTESLNAAIAAGIAVYELSNPEIGVLGSEIRRSARQFPNNLPPS